MKDILVLLGGTVPHFQSMPDGWYALRWHLQEPVPGQWWAFSQGKPSQLLLLWVQASWQASLLEGRVAAVIWLPIKPENKVRIKEGGWRWREGREKDGERGEKTGERKYQVLKILLECL